MAVVIDIEGFKDIGNQFIVKEFAISALEVNEHGNFLHDWALVDPPRKWDDLLPKYKETNQWLSRHYHGLHWETPGDIEYQGLSDFVNRMVEYVQHIYVQGAEKKKWVDRILRKDIPVDDLNDLGCPVLNYLEEEKKCTYHHSLYDGSPVHYYCAVDNVVRLKKWYARYEAGSLEKSLKKFCENQHLNSLTSQEISYLPKHFIATVAKDTVDAAWEKLPEMMKRDPSIAGLRYCRTHWSSLGTIPLSPTPPPIAECPLCQYQR